MFNLKDAFFAFIILGILILIARVIRQKIQWLRSLYIPSSIVAGVLALLLGPGVLGAIAGPNSSVANGLFSETIRTVWSQSPGIFINIVFAAIFLGETIPSPREIWRKAAPQVAFGQTLAWGQYVVGLLLVLLVLTPLFGIDPMAGALIEVAFEGGHGTAAGMAETFVQLGFPEGADLSLGLATVGIVSGIVAGTALANWGRRNGKLQIDKIDPNQPDQSTIKEDRESREIQVARANLLQDLLIDPLTLNLGFVALALLIGWLILQGLVAVENLTWATQGFKLMAYVPLFPMALIGGLIVQLILERLGLSFLIIRPLIANIAGVALDIVIVTAIATISLKVLGSNIWPFIILSIAGIVWNVWVFLFLGPRLLPSFWFERGIGDMGQSMGVTATGIVLMRMVDPQNKSGAFESFAYKQLLFEPIVGGGLFTAAAPALINQFGPIAVLGLTGLILIAWLAFGFWNFKQTIRNS
ncbi:sodium/glutamate symporter [Planktothricoides raciborskii]|uniref:Sodium/glutamate symporter n=1 Tax=Planktothricoides raciborskii GIHE-MW2 TaxID=2792601 RepID=A0AAU8JC92_9CYAN